MRINMKLSTSNQKVEWLLKHKELWKGWPDDFSQCSMPKLRIISKLMKREKIYSDLTSFCDSVRAIHKHILNAKEKEYEFDVK